MSSSSRVDTHRVIFILASIAFVGGLFAQSNQLATQFVALQSASESYIWMPPMLNFDRDTSSASTTGSSHQAKETKTPTPVAATTNAIGLAKRASEGKKMQEIEPSKKPAVTKVTGSSTIKVATKIVSDHRTNVAAVVPKLPLASSVKGTTVSSEKSSTETFGGPPSDGRTNVTEKFQKLLVDNGRGDKIHNHSQSVLRVLIAKTISVGDIEDTVLDIKELSIRDENITVDWKIFCHQQETHEKLLTALAKDEPAWNSTNSKYKVEVHFEERRYKVLFWKKYLSPTEFHQNIKYIWLVDGDVPLRFMAWTCFWKLVDEKYKPAIFEPAILTRSADRDDSLYYAGKAHFQKCYSSMPKSNFHQLQALETHIVDIQTPGFRRDAWELIYNAFDRELPGWGDFFTDYGPDFVWCNMLEKELLGRNASDENNANDWTQVQRTCNVSNATTSTFDSMNDLPIACLILHETPVYHRDTQSLTAQRNASLRALWHSRIDADLKRYRETFAKYALTLKNDHPYFRSFVRPDEESSCQACMTSKCMRAAKMI